MNTPDYQTTFRPEPINLLCRIETELETIKTLMRQGQRASAYSHGAELAALAHELEAELEQAYQSRA